MFKVLLCATLVGRIYSSPTQQPLSGIPSELRLLQFSSSHTEWVSNEAIAHLGVATDCNALPHAQGLTQVAVDVLCNSQARSFGAYVDVTEDTQLSHLSPPRFSDLPYKTPNASRHSEVLDWDIDVKELKETVSGLAEGFKTRHVYTHLITQLVADAIYRYYRSSHSRSSGEWLKARMTKLLAIHPSLPTSARTVLEVTNAGFDQPNLIATIPGTDPNLSSVILGGHYDSISAWSRFMVDSAASGADDDASGTATVLGTLHLLASANYTGLRTIEFHAYAAEEAGLLGSGTVARGYKAQGHDVYGMLQLEMNGYQNLLNGHTSTITIPSDPQPDFSNYLVALAKQYAPKANVVLSECEYGCSDHFSFHLAGYRAGTLAEAGPRDKNLNPKIHTSGDVISLLNFEAMADFVRVAAGFVVELSSQS